MGRNPLASVHDWFQTSLIGRAMMRKFTTNVDCKGWRKLVVPIYQVHTIALLEKIKLKHKLQTKIK